jgi:hypothetical protein
MYGVTGIRFALRMVPTPEQMVEIRESFDKAFAAHGVPTNPNRVLSGIGEEVILSIDEAILMLRECKALEDAIPVPAPGSLTAK